MCDPHEIRPGKKRWHSRKYPIFSLSKKDNGVDGALYLSGTQLLLVGQNKRIVDSYRIPGEDSRLSYIKGTWTGGPIFFVTDDESIGFGSYNGIISRPFQIKDGRIQWVVVQDDGHTERVDLMQSLKTHWKVESSPDMGQIDVLEVSCRPDFEKIDQLGNDYNPHLKVQKTKIEIT